MAFLEKTVDMTSGEGEQLTLDLVTGNSSIMTSSALQELVSEVDAAVGRATAMQKRRKRTKKPSELLNQKKQVTMSNKFIVALEEGSKFAFRLSRIAIAQIPMGADTLPATVISAEDIEQMGLTRTRLTGHMNEVIDDILSYRIKLAYGDTLKKSAKLGGINMFSMATVIPGKGAIVVQLNPALREHFLNLRADFTQYALPVVLRMSGFASTKLHEVLLSRSRAYGADVLRFSIEDLMIILNYRPKPPRKKINDDGTIEELPKAKNPLKPSTFVNNAIKRAVEDINGYTELHVDFKGIKTGREYTDIRFVVQSGWANMDEKQKFEADYSAWKRDPTSVDARTAEYLSDIYTATVKMLETGEGEIHLNKENNYSLKTKKTKANSKKVSAE